MKPNSFSAVDALYHMHPYTDAIKNELSGANIMVRGKNIFVTDENGTEYLDGMAGLWSASLGFSERRLAEAAYRQMRELPFYHGFSGSGNDKAALLAEELIAWAPVPMTKVFFVNSGSEAIDTAIKMVWYFNNALGRSKKKKIISRQKAYHGVTLVAASLTGRAGNHTGFDLPLPGILHTDCPHYYRIGEDGESEQAFVQRLARNLEEMILREGPETIAAFIAEPVQGSGGVLIPPPGYFSAIQDLLRRHEILLIADEVICGFHRTGPAWGSQALGLSPDVITVAKQLSASYAPIGAVMLNETVFRPIAEASAKLGNFGHGFTYGGHPLAAAIALETLKIYKTDGIASHVAQISPVFQQYLRHFADHRFVGEIRSIGLMGAIEWVLDPSTKEPFPASWQVGPHFVAFCRMERLILRNAGDSIVFSPPLIITADQIDDMFRRFTRALNRLERWLEDVHGL